MDRRRTRRAPRLVAAGVSGDVLTVGNLVLTAQPAAAAVTASFNAGAGGLLSVFADSLDNTVTVSRNDAGAILVDGGAVGAAGGQPTVANVGAHPGVRPRGQRHSHPVGDQRCTAAGEPVRRQWQRQPDGRFGRRPDLRSGRATTRCGTVAVWTSCSAAPRTTP